MSEIVCTLSDAEKRERKTTLRRELMPRVRTITELANGYIFWFDRAEGELARIASFVELESQCCAFLSFGIRVDSGADRIALQLEGPEGAKEFLRPMVEESNRPVTASRLWTAVTRAPETEPELQAPTIPAP